jgi:hypothetical protein
MQSQVTQQGPAGPVGGSVEVAVRCSSACECHTAGGTTERIHPCNKVLVRAAACNPYLIYNKGRLRVAAYNPRGEATNHRPLTWTKTLRGPK